MKSNLITIFIPTLRGGGVQRMMLNLAKNLIGRGFEVDLLVSRAEGPYLSEIPSQVRMVNFKSARLIASLPKLVSYLKRYQPRVLFSAMNSPNLLALWAGRLSRTNTPIIISVRNQFSRELHNYQKPRYRLIPTLTKYFYSWADEIIAISQGVALDLADITGLSLDRIRVIYNPVVVPELWQKGQESVTHPWFVSGEVPVILGVGRLTKQKDFPTLIRAFAQVRQVSSVRLVILGEGEERASLEALIKDLGLDDDVCLPGFMNNPYAYMNKANVFVLSSAWEGFGNVLVEAMACGTTIVSTNCPSGPREILAEGKYGRLVPVGDYVSLAKAILQSLENPFDPTILRSRAEEFTVEKIAERYLQLIEN
ncbi:MAG: glycosyltransferase [Xenococcaceae cyanobacterium MO_188.B32]|nr:glycosyltransferase [Xenococcaceae cyanobacterium MO_188.B32]